MNNGLHYYDGGNTTMNRMYRSMSVAVLLYMFILTGCQREPAATPDSSAPAQIQVLGARDVLESQLLAQDTLFEDGSIPTSWQNAGFDDPQGFKRFIAKFQAWVATGNVDSIVARVQFPLKNYPTENAFRKQYSQIFDASTKDIVAGQRLDRIFRNMNGAMIGDGKIWFSPTSDGYRIIAIN